MTRLALLPLLFIAAVLQTGCVRSLHPIYTDQTLTYDSAFIGTWVDDDDGSRIEISAGEGNDSPDAIKSYRVVHTDKDKHAAHLIGHLAKVGEFLVADLTVADEKGLPESDFYRAHLFPLHTFWIVRRAGDDLRIRMIDYDWMKKFVAENPTAIAHYKSNDDVILTASPEELQKFLLAHAKDEGMLTAEEIFRRGKPPATTAPTSPPP